MPDRDAAPRRYRGVAGAGRNRDVSALRKDATGLARCAYRMVSCVRPYGRGANRCQPRCSSTQSGPDGGARSGTRGDGAGTVSDVARFTIGLLTYDPAETGILRSGQPTYSSSRGTSNATVPPHRLRQSPVKGYATAAQHNGLAGDGSSAVELAADRASTRSMTTAYAGCLLFYGRSCCTRVVSS